MNRTENSGRVPHILKIGILSNFQSHFEPSFGQSPSIMNSLRFLICSVLFAISLAANFNLVYPEGGKYTGELQQPGDRRHGKGTMTYSTGDVIEGEWKDDSLNGFGKIKYASGNTYEGNWVDNKHNGKGTKTWATGAVYVGDWVNDRIQGKGTYTYQSGNVYTGKILIFLQHSICSFADFLCNSQVIGGAE